MSGAAPKVRVKRVMPANASSREQPSSWAIVLTAIEYPETDIETTLERHGKTQYGIS